MFENTENKRLKRPGLAHLFKKYNPIKTVKEREVIQH